MFTKIILKSHSRHLKDPALRRRWAAETGRGNGGFEVLLISRKGVDYFGNKFTIEVYKG
jgi:hypothetical protein